MFEQAQEEANRRAFTGECYTCRDTGYAAGMLNTPCNACARGRAIVAERRQQQVRAIVQAANIPPRASAYTFSSYPHPDQVQAYEDILRFLEHWDGCEGLILKGDYGRGKTGLLVSAMKVIAEHWVLTDRHTYRMLFTTGADLLDYLRSGFEDHSYMHRLQRVKTIPLLVIDDLGVEQPTEWMIERLFVIFNERYNHNLPTFMSTNYGTEQLKPRIGERVVDRLLETCQIIDVCGPNLRLE